MRITDDLTDDVVLAEIGERLARTRLERNMTQAQLAHEAGVALVTVKRLEAGEPVKLPNFLRVLRVFGLLSSLDVVVPEPTISPIDRLKLHGRQRQRATGRRGRRADEPHPDEPWAWGDEQ
jgi:putative transcriptional regulator